MKAVSPDTAFDFFTAYMIRFIKEHWLFLVVFITSAVLRFTPLFDYQFTLDELSGLNRTQFSSFSDLMDQGVKIDAHPALIQLLIFTLVKLFGYTDWIIKLPFLLFSMGTLVYAYFFGLRNFSKRVGLFAMLVFAFSLVFVFYAAIARMYISGVFFSVAMLYHFYEIFFQNNTKKMHFVFLGVFALLSALNQHINALFAFTLFLSGIFFLSKATTKIYLVTAALTVLAYLPHLPVTLYQLGIGGIDLEQGGWLEKPSLSIVLFFLKILFGTGAAYSVFVVLVIFKNVYERPTIFQRKHLFLFLIFLVNFLIVYFYSIHRASVYQHSVMLFSGVCMVFAVCACFDLQKWYWFYPAFALMAYVLIHKTYVEKEYYGQCVKTVFDYQFEKTTKYKKELGDKNVYPIFFDADDFMKKMYFEKYSTDFDCKISADSTTQRIRCFSDFVSSLPNDYLVLSSSMPIHDAIAKQYFPYLIENTNTQANNYKLFSKKQSDSSRVVPSEVVLKVSTPSATQNFFYTAGVVDQFIKDGNSFEIRSTEEYPFESRNHYKFLIKKEGEVMLLKCKFKRNVIAPVKADLCVTITDNISGELYQYAANSVSDYRVGPDSTVTAFASLYIGSKHAVLKKKASSVRGYVWNKGMEQFKMLDFEFSKIDYWPQKWQFWK